MSKSCQANQWKNLTETFSCKNLAFLITFLCRPHFVSWLSKERKALNIQWVDLMWKWDLGGAWIKLNRDVDMLCSVLRMSEAVAAGFLHMLQRRWCRTTMHYRGTQVFWLLLFPRLHPLFCVLLFCDCRKDTFFEKVLKTQKHESF